MIAANRKPGRVVWIKHYPSEISTRVESIPAVLLSHCFKNRGEASFFVARVGDLPKIYRADELYEAESCD